MKYEILKRKRGKRVRKGRVWESMLVIACTLKICIAQKLFFFFFEKRNDFGEREGE